MARPNILTRLTFEEAFTNFAQAPLIFALVDIDHFKWLCDALGRTEGDRVLRKVERLLVDALPGDSVIGRLGSDEYGILLPETSPERALLLFDEAIRHFHIYRDPKWSRLLGLSAGLASRPSHADTFAGLYLSADEALFRAKREGKGRVCIYTETKKVLKSNYYSRSQLERLAKLAKYLGKTEASLLREALAELIKRYQEKL
jgi:diguanylate cyclase